MHSKSGLFANVSNETHRNPGTVSWVKIRLQCCVSSNVHFRPVGLATITEGGILHTAGVRCVEHVWLTLESAIPAGHCRILPPVGSAIPTGHCRILPPGGSAIPAGHCRILPPGGSALPAAGHCHILPPVASDIPAGHCRIVPSGGSTIGIARSACFSRRCASNDRTLELRDVVSFTFGNDGAWRMTFALARFATGRFFPQRNRNSNGNN